MSAVARLIERDGPVCVWCGRRPWTSDLTVEHLLPRARRGRSASENLALACRTCNRLRRTRSVSAFVRAQRARGVEPQLERLAAALGRLSQSASSTHAAYGRRELELLSRQQGTRGRRGSATFPAWGAREHRDRPAKSG